MFIAINVGGGLGWWAGERGGIWVAFLASAVGSMLGIWVVWHYRDYIG